MQNYPLMRLWSDYCVKPAIFRKFERFWVVTLMLSILAGAVLSSQAHAVGFRWIVDNDLKIGVWYPSPATEQNARLGPFDVVLAMDAPPNKHGLYQVVLLSHGNSGRARNHHLTAKALVQAGFIVIAPLHRPDHLMAGEKIPHVLEWRATEFRHALEAVLNKEEFRYIVDLSRIHALGYSLGALTALNAAGAPIDVAAADAHCAREDDPAFCDTPPRSVRRRIKKIRKVTSPRLNRQISSLHFPLGIVNGGVAVVAPVGQGVGIDPNTFMANSVMVVGLKQDTITLPQFHASNLNALFSGHVKTEYHLIEGHHSAFIAPFAKRVTDIEDIPAAIDPKGFDRLAFLKNINNDLVAFFRRARDM